MRYACILAAALVLAAVPTLRADSRTIDLEPFFRQLEVLGLSTGELRVVAAQTRIARSSDPRGAPEARLAGGTLSLPASYLTPDGSALAPELTSHQIRDLIREFSYARDALDGVPPDHDAARFLGRAIAEVHAWTHWVVRYNLTELDVTVGSPAQVGAMGGTLVLPDPKAGRAETAASEHVFGLDEEGTPRPELYHDRFRMKPPADAAEQLRRLNSMQDTWMDGVRRRLRSARERWASRREGRSLTPSFFGLSE